MTPGREWRSEWCKGVSLVKDIPGRGNSSCKDVEVGVHVIRGRSSEKASMHAAEGARERAVLCDTGKLARTRPGKPGRSW